jgi:hypothetical protein
MPNALHDIEAELAAFADRVKTALVPVVHDGAETLARLSASRIVQEVLQFTEPLDPADEEMAAALIRTLGEKAAQIAQLTAPPAETPAGADAEPPAA